MKTSLASFSLLVLLCTALAQPALAMDPQIEKNLQSIDPAKHFDEVKKYLGTPDWNKSYVIGDETTYDQSACESTGKNCKLMAQVTSCITQVSKDSYQITQLTVAPKAKPSSGEGEMTLDYFKTYDGYQDVLGYIFYMMSFSKQGDFSIRDVRPGTFVIKSIGEEIETLEIRMGAKATPVNDMPVVAVSNHPALPGIAQKVRDAFVQRTQEGDRVFKTELISVARGDNGNKCKQWK